MAGHSKWHNIKLRKAKVDTEKAKVFAKVSREIIVATRQGGADPEANPRLRLAIQKAREASMPNDNIQRAIRRGTGEEGGAQYEEVVYEGYGPGGVAVLIEAQTDNRNRTVADLRHAFGKYGGNLGESGCVAWLFHHKGVVVIDHSGADEDALMEAAIDAGAEDIAPQDSTFEVITAFEDLERVKAQLQAQGFALLNAETAMIPSSTVPLEGETARRMLKLMQTLEELDDVQRVNANFDIPDDMMEEQ